MRGSEFTREGVVAGHWIEKFTSCPGQSRATVTGQAETTLRRADQPGQVGRWAGVQRDLCREASLQVQGSDYIGSMSGGPQEIVWGSRQAKTEGWAQRWSQVLLQVLLELGVAGASFEKTCVTSFEKT